MSIRYFDMFAGIGGFRSGLEATGGFECVGYCEINRDWKPQVVLSVWDTVKSTDTQNRLTKHCIRHKENYIMKMQQQSIPNSYPILIF